MIAAAASIFGSRIVVGGRAYTVRPPTVLTAFAVNAAVEHGGEEVNVLLADAVREWLPLSLRSVLFSRSVRTEERRRVILTAMLAGVPDERLKQAQQQAEALRDKVRRLGWTEVLARYRSLYGGDVLAESWPVFLALADEIDAERARVAVDWAGGYAAARLGKDQWKALLRRGGYGPPPPTEEEAEAGREQAAMIEAQLAALNETGSMLNWREFIGSDTIQAEA